jgi:hypothetical protein
MLIEGEKIVRADSYEISPSKGTVIRDEITRHRMRELSTDEIHNVVGGSISEIILASLPSIMECHTFSTGTTVCVFL